MERSGGIKADEMVETRTPKRAPVTVIAEAGVNHNGDLDTARRLVEAASAAGADAVKFQTFSTEALVTSDASKAAYQAERTGGKEGQLEMLERLELSHENHRALKALCDALDIEFLSTPFDAKSADFLAEEIGVARLKLPSGEITNAPLLLHVAQLGLPIILSTGMSTLDEVAAALGILAHGFSAATEPPNSIHSIEQGAIEGLVSKVTLLHCTSEYPAPLADANLNVLPAMAARFGLPVGLSDHTPGHAAALGAVALGATVIEKHITLDKTMPGPDHGASLEPKEFDALVSNLRDLEAALGSSDKRPQASELGNREVARRSLVALRPIKSGEAFNPQNVGAKRPGTGLSPMLYWQVLGQRALRDFESDELISLEPDQG
jgi:N-acetylneuraminate synthase